MQGGIRRGLHIDDDDEGAKKPDQYGGINSFTQDLTPPEKEAPFKEGSMICFSVEDQGLLPEDLLLISPHLRISLLKHQRFNHLPHHHQVLSHNNPNLSLQLNYSLVKQLVKKCQKLPPQLSLQAQVIKIRQS